MSENGARTDFSHLRRSQKLGCWVAEIRVLGDFSMMRVADLVGKTVNIGDKDGGVWEGVTVTAFSEGTGFLTLEGGQFGSVMSPDDEARLLEHATSLSAYDIARGYIHE